MTDTTQPPAETLAGVREAAAYEPNEAEALAARLDESIAFKVYSSSDDHIRDAAAMLRRLSALTRRAGGDAMPAGEVERIAQIIYEEDDPWHRAWPWPRLDPKAQGGAATADRYRDIARAVLAATPKPPAGGDAIPAGVSAVMGRILMHYGEDPSTLARIKGMVAQYREAPFRSADWLAGEIMRILDSEPANDITLKPPAGGDAEEKGWDHRYRPLAWGEVILDTDECRRDDGTWVTGICVGQKAPDPAYTSHRVYRRLVAPAGGDAGAVEARAYGAVLDKWDAVIPLSYEDRQALIADLAAALALPAPVVEGEVEKEAPLVTKMLAYRQCAIIARRFSNRVDDYGRSNRHPEAVQAARDVADLIDGEAGKMSLEVAALSEGRSHG